MARYSLEIKRSVAGDILGRPVRGTSLRRSAASPRQLSTAELLRGVPKEDVARILKAIAALAALAALADEPRGPDSEKLSSRELYRVRQGNYRILYEIRDADRVVVVVTNARRSQGSRRASP